MPSGDVEQESLLLQRPLSSNGLPTSLGGIINLIGNGSVTPIDYYVEALPGERLICARAMIHIVGAGNIASGQYGDIIGGIANGIQIVYRRSGENIDFSDGMPIKINEDWGRWCYDGQVVAIGPNTPYFQARWSFWKYGTKWGLLLEEGDRIGIKVRDDLSALTEQTIIIEGVHIGVPDDRWKITI